MRSIFLRWQGKTFRVQHEDIIGFVVYEADGLLPGQARLTLGLMYRDGSTVPMHTWAARGYDVEIS